MSLRDELRDQIRREMTEDPVARKAMVGHDRTAATDIEAGYSVLNRYVIALENALFKLADEVEALRIG